MFSGTLSTFPFLPWLFKLAMAPFQAFGLFLPLCKMTEALSVFLQSLFFFFFHFPEVNLGFLGLFQAVFKVLGISATTLLSPGRKPASFFSTPRLLFSVILLASVLS